MYKFLKKPVLNQSQPFNHKLVMPATCCTEWFKCHIFTIFIIGTFQQISWGQISGKVTNISGEPLPFSNVLLLNLIDSSLVKGTVADQTGRYQIEDVSQGDYMIQVSSVGYKPYFTGPVAINESKQSKEVENFTLKEDVQQLNDLVITEKKPLYEQKIDRLVVNVQSSITFSGNTALEVLQKSPGVRVNRQNNSISLNGKGGVVVMINNKITHLPIDAVVQMLDGMSSENIEKIELITTPPSKYDAEGTAGIIHIVMIENQDMGTNGSFGLTAGYKRAEMLGGNVSIFHRKNKIGFLFDYSINYDKPVQPSHSYRSLENDGIYWMMNTQSKRYASTIVQNLRAGVEYNLSDKTKANILLTGFSRNWQMDALTENSNQIGVDSTQVTTMKIKETNIWRGTTVNIGLDQQIGRNQSLSMDFDYIYYKNHNPSTYDNHTVYNQPYEPTESQINVGKETPLSIQVVKIDYSNHLSDNFNLEAGLKGTLSHFKNDVSVANFDQGQWEAVDSLTNIAYLDEKIFAAYISSNWKVTDDITINAGLRYEFTGTNLDTHEERSAVDRKLNNLFPTIFFQKKLNKTSNFQLSYTKRITRPTFNDMAPFVFFVDPYTFFAGNPNLLPAITDAYKADLNWQSMLLSIQYSDSKNEIANFQPKFNPENNIEILFSRNMDHLRTWNLTSSIPFSPSKWWDVQTNLSGNYQTLISDGESEVYHVASFTANIMNTFSLPKDFAIELTGFYQSKSLMGIWELLPMGSVNVGIQKKLKNDMGTLRLAGNNIFNTSNLRVSALTHHSGLNMDFDTRSISLTYTIGFGNHKLRKVNIKSGSEAEQRRIN